MDSILESGLQETYANISGAWDHTPFAHLHHNSQNPQPLVVNPHDLVMTNRITSLPTNRENEQSPDF